MQQVRKQSPVILLVGLLVCSVLSLPGVHADGPTDVQFVGLNALTYSGADETGLLTTNSTVRQGDYLTLEIPVENTGGDLQVASIVLEVSQADWNETVYFDEISIQSLTTNVLTYLSSNPVMEGSLDVELSINETSETLTDSVHIGPPPLPSVVVNLELISTAFGSGDLIQFNATSSNILGERAFNGFLACIFLEEEVYNQSLNVGVGESVVDTFSLYARPGIVECHLGGDRNQSNQTVTMHSLEGLSSAVFDEAGSSGFSFIGGPWHVGDDLSTSFIVRNQGDAAGTARLNVLHDGIEYVSESLSLDSGSAGELQLVFEDLSVGVHNFSWMITSTDGIVSSGLEGTATLVVQSPQAMFVEVDAEVSASGVQLNWNASITNGVDREIKLRYGYRVQGTDVYVNEQIFTLGSGTQTGQTTLGEIQGDTVVVRMEPVGWIASTNSYIATASLDVSLASYSVDIDPITLPREPVEGEDVTVTIMLQNSGQDVGPVGTLYLTDSDGLLFGQLTTEALQPSSSRNLDFTFVVPNGNEILLNAEWRYGTTSVEDEQSILVSPRVVDEASAEIPFVAIGGGIAAACCVILVLHLRRGAGGQSESTPSGKEKKHQQKQEEKKVEPVEKSCPACERILRIPGDYSGTVRCPDCSEKFLVESEEVPDLDDELEEIADVEPEGPPVETKVEIGCPQCNSKLRVPSSYTGSVRCPSCSEVFSAN